MKPTKLIKFSYNQNNFVYIPCSNSKWELLEKWISTNYTCASDREIATEGIIIILQILLHGAKRFDSTRLKNIFKKSFQNITLSVKYSDILKTLEMLDILVINRPCQTLPGIYSIGCSDSFMLSVDNKLYTSLAKRVH